MAQIVAPIPARTNAVFASVFPKTSRPRASQEGRRVKVPNSPSTIKEDLNRALKPLLGIQISSRYAYGLDGPTAEGQPFVIPITKCASMRLVRRPNQTDFLQQRSRLLKTPIWQSIRTWQTQLGSDAVRKLLAEVLDGVLCQYVRSAYSQCWVEDVIPHLEFWVQHIFSGLVEMCLEVTSSSYQSTGRSANTAGELGDVRRWQDIALTNLGALRVEELFDMVKCWDKSAHGINDLKHFITSPATRTYLTNHFTETISSRLLHPGSSTIEILQHYISIIRAFRKLDPKGVLLDRVARRIRKFLKDREDTVKVIVSGLLSDPLDIHGEPIPPNSEVLSELALELIRRNESDDDDDNELDWDNMEWMPDPIDAAPNYMKSKNTDVIGSVTSLFESKDVFVKELQTTLADRLLKNKPNFDLEFSVVNHLKQRFGDNALQGCEVMLRDIVDSRKVDEVIRKEHEVQIKQPPAPLRTQDQPELHAKILSRLFWPSLPSQSFLLPTPISSAQQSYETSFEALKESRKLTWLPSQGHVEVELQLSDRVVTEEVLPYQASVIYAFQDHEGAVSVTTLAIHLEMAETLVRSACIFWLARQVLVEKGRDEFVVLERLPPPHGADDSASVDPDVQMSNTLRTATNASTTQSNISTTNSSAAALAAAEAAATLLAREAEETTRKAKMQMYTQFIVSMLTNQGAMPLGRIAMMLGMVVPGGFPYGAEELREFLAGMVREGRVEVGVGGIYRIV